MTTLIVFAIMPRVPVQTKNLPGQVACMKAMRNARIEMTKLVAGKRLHTALGRNFPRATDGDLKIGDEVLVYRKKTGR